MTFRPPQCSEIEPGGHEDCTWCSGVMLENAAYADARVPSTRAEYAALRVAGGDGPAENPGDGSNLVQLATGMQKRYGWTPPVLLPVNASSLWADIAPGMAVVVQGSMAAVDDHYRRWDPGFRGAHAALVIREDALDRVWWMNPQAPNTYSGEFMPKATLLAFWRAQPGARIATVRVGSRALPDTSSGEEEPMNPLPISDPTPKVVDPIEGRRLFLPDMTPSVTVSRASGVASPFGSLVKATNYRAIYVTTGGVKQLLLIANRDCASIVDVPSTDAARIAGIKAKVAAAAADVAND